MIMRWISDMPSKIVKLPEERAVSEGSWPAGRALVRRIPGFAPPEPSRALLDLVNVWTADYPHTACRPGSGLAASHLRLILTPPPRLALPEFWEGAPAAPLTRLR